MAIQFQIIGHVALITLDAPESMNALTIGDLRHLRKALNTAQDDDQVRVIVLTGAGDKAFCTGANLKATLPPSTGFASGHFKSRAAEAEEGGYTRLIDLGDLEIWKPMIAAIHGYCLGAAWSWRCSATCASPATKRLSLCPKPRWPAFRRWVACST